MVDSVSTLGLAMASSTNITSGQSLLSKLSGQLSTGIYSSNLTDYSSSNAQKLLNFNNKVSEQNGFLAVIDALTPRLETMSTSLDGIDSTVSDAYSTLLSASTYNESTNSSIQSAIKGYMDDISYYLNQQIGDRYVFSGTRYDQAPCISGDAIAALPDPATDTCPVTQPAVPAYDADYDSTSPADPYPEAYVEDSVLIDSTKSLTYGVSSDDEAFQEVIMGLRYAYTATTDEANYEDNMKTALDYLSSGLSKVRALSTDVSNAYSTLEKTSDTISNKITSLTNQVSNIEGVDLNEVGVKITVLQAQLEATYSVTSSMINLSILDYL